MRARISILVSVTVAVLAVSLSVEAGSSSCTYNPDNDIVTVHPGGASVTKIFVGSGGQIQVEFNGTGFDCGDATVGNTLAVFFEGFLTVDEVIIITQNGAGGGFPSSLSLFIAAEGGLDFFRLVGSPGPDSFRFGEFEGGIAVALYASGDPSIFMDGIEFPSARMLGGDDSVTGRPGAGFDGPLTIALEAKGNKGLDSLIGGTAGDDLSGASGNDKMKGLAGGDFMVAGTGDDVMGGGPGVDTCHSGPGDDRLRGCESES